MPTATPIRVNVRVIHRRLGRGKIVRLYGDHREVAVLFDGDRSADQGPHPWEGALATSESDVCREIVAAATELLRHDGGQGSEGYHAIKSYDARERLQAAIAKHTGTAPTPVYEAPRDLSIPVRVRGVFRDAGEPRSLSVALTERPTDDDIRSLHEFLRGWEP